MKNFPNNSIDYIITDPPHGNRQPYLELSMMWNSWLDKDVNYADEIVISESKDRNKDIKNYNELLFASFCEIERVLKPDHYFSLMFNSLDDETWINLIENMNKLNFNLEKIETLAYSANSVVQDTRKAGLKTDFVLTFQKNLSKRKKNVEMLSLSSNDSYLIELIENFIKKQNGPKVETYQILNYLVYTLLQENKFFRLSEIVPFLKNYEQREKNQIDGCSQK